MKVKVGEKISSDYKTVRSRDLEIGDVVPHQGFRCVVLGKLSIDESLVLFLLNTETKCLFSYVGKVISSNHSIIGTVEELEVTLVYQGKLK